MPYRPKGPCTWPGCNTLVIGGRCSKHPYIDYRPSAHDRGYSRGWRRLRNVYIRNHPVCEIQEKCNGAAAVEVDHILALRNGGDCLDEANLQSTCKRCHGWKTYTVDQRDTLRLAE